MKRSAIWALASLGDVESIDLFTWALESSDETTQRAGIEGFRETRDPSGVARLLSLLANPQIGHFTREQIVAALTAVGDDNAVTGLADMLRVDLRNPAPLLGTREWAWTAKRLPAILMVNVLIEAIADQEYWGTDNGRRDEAVRALAQDARTEVTAHLQSLDATGDVSWRQTEAVLINIMRTGSWRGLFVGERYDDLECCCIVLARAGSERCADALMSLLTRASGDDSLATWAARILSFLGDRAHSGDLYRHWAQLIAEPYTGPVISQSSWLKHELSQTLGTCGDAAVLRSLASDLCAGCNPAFQDGIIKAIGELAVGLNSPNTVFDLMLDSVADPDRLGLANSVIRHSLHYAGIVWWHSAAAEYPRLTELRDKVIAQSDSGSAPVLLAAGFVGLDELSIVLHQAIREGDARQAYQATEAVFFLNDKEAIPHIRCRIERFCTSSSEENSPDLLYLSLIVLVQLGGTVSVPDARWNLLDGKAYIRAVLASGGTEDKARVASLLLSQHSPSFIDGEISRVQ